MRENTMKHINRIKNLPKQKVNHEAIKNAGEGSETQKYNDRFQFQKRTYILQYTCRI